MRAALRLVRQLTELPADMNASILAESREAGLSDEDLERIACVVAHFTIMNRAADTFGFPVPQGRERARVVRLLGLVDYVAGGRWPSPSHVTDVDGVVRPVEFAEGRRALLEAKGALDPEVRADIEAYVAGLCGAVRTEAAPPEALAVFVGRVAGFAWGIEDADIEALRADGWSDAAIYEIVFTVGVGAAAARIEALYAQMYPAA